MYTTRLVPCEGGKCDFEDAERATPLGCLGWGHTGTLSRVQDESSFPMRYLYLR